jgi:hypothetical protein
MFRCHGTEVRREPWHYGDPGDMFYDAMLAATRLRYRLMPYIYSLAADVWKNNGTMLRMLAFDFGKDENALDIADQYMFGPALMVCPVTEPMYYEVGGVPIENMKTLQTFMESQFGERTPAVTQEPMTEPVTEPMDITPPADTDLAAYRRELEERNEKRA